MSSPFPRDSHLFSLLAPSTEGRVRTHLRGAQGSCLAYALARLARGSPLQPPLAVLTPTEQQARALTRDLLFFLGAADHQTLALPRVLRLPSRESLPYAEISSDRGAVLGQMAALERLTAARERPATGSGGKHTTQAKPRANVDLCPEVLVCSAAALRRKVVPHEDFAALRLQVQVNADLDRERLVEVLVASGYQRCPVVDDPGTLAVRGGIVDVFPPLHRYPARIEFFADIVETIRLFDAATQRTLRGIDNVMLHPVRETLLRDHAPTRSRLLALADELHYPTRGIRALIEEVESGLHFPGIEALVPAFFDALQPPWTYLPDDTHWVIVDPNAVTQSLVEEDLRASTAHQARLDGGHIAFAAPEFFITADEFTAHMNSVNRTDVGSTDVALDGSAVQVACSDNADLVAQLTRARNERGEELLANLVSHLTQWTADGRPVLIAANGASRADRLEALLHAHDITATRRNEIGTPELLEGTMPAGVHLQAGDLGRGFRTTEGLVVISHEEIFGPKTTRRASRGAVGSRLGDLRSLTEGDFIVHVDHGVARYRGLVQLEVAGVPADFLLLEYARADKLYLPIHRMNQVQRYVGADGKVSNLDRLGGSTWQRKRRKVQIDVRKFGEELLQLYAQRAALSGFAHPEPDRQYLEFEATFPFTETADQGQAIADAVADLTASRPMDRLICGDVGFGKTEVALRAAFLVAMSGRQVVVLAPTTVLVEQHLRTFNERMAPYPLRIESISRFRRPDELREALADIAAGKVDIVIGTHRLLSADARFKDLGLLIIDEEQRFGVKHKEWIKRMRTQIDVLALTATPIPRTLQLSMVGLREISVIATPPVDRVAIRTVVCRHDDSLVAEAIRKEIARGGQVFFVHNEVKSIDRQAQNVSRLVPEARVAVAHGQMDSRRLERVMLSFVRGHQDVLVCSTIIESGLDIPRANTMFVSRADRFGLSQLYQLRGRIGRSHMRAYCYLLASNFEQMSGQARQRLQLLQQFTELGSGFSIASYDLELRGAGDLLGAKQSGHIAAVGFETYARILEESVAELKGEPIVRETDPDLSVRIPAFIPDDYVEDTGQRLELYKRLSDVCRDATAVRGILEELRDRYGTLPTEVETLGELMLVKGLASRLRAAVVELTESRLSLTLEDNTPLARERIAALVRDSNSGYRLRPPARLVRQLTSDEQTQPLRTATRVLNELLALAP